MTWNSSEQVGGPSRRTRLMVRMLPVFTKLTVPLFRLTHGRIGGSATQGAPIVLLTTIGRRSGRRRTVAVGHFRDGDDVIVMGTNGGRPALPGWVYNLHNRPEADIEAGDERYAATAAFLEGDEWRLQWQRLVARHPVYEQARRWAAPRQIPLIRLQRRTGGAFG